MGSSTLIIGGARSGKSHFAQELALKSAQPVLFVATAEALDKEMADRIAMHRKTRPTAWRTLEISTHVGNRIRQELGSTGTVVIDCITLLVSNMFGRHSSPSGEITDTVEKDIMAEIQDIVDCTHETKASFIIVTNEVGLGLVPDNTLGRLYRDLLGKANQRLAQEADRVYLMVSGLPLLIKGSPP